MPLNMSYIFKMKLDNYLDASSKLDTLASAKFLTLNHLSPVVRVFHCMPGFPKLFVS